jgi:hypothetical protein
MRYLAWAVLALVAYSLVPPFMKPTTADIPGDVVLLMPNTMLVVVAAGLIINADVYWPCRT